MKDKWFKVSKPDLYKECGMKAQEKFSAVTITEMVKFFKIKIKNVDVKNN